GDAHARRHVVFVSRYALYYVQEALGIIELLRRELQPVGNKRHSLIGRRQFHVIANTVIEGDVVTYLPAILAIEAEGLVDDLRGRTAKTLHEDLGKTQTICLHRCEGRRIEEELRERTAGYFAKTEQS